MPSDGLVKLTNEDTNWRVRRVNSDKFNVKTVSQIYGVTERRVQQLAKMYRDSGEIPTLNPHRRPRTYLSDDQRVVIGQVWEETRVGARLLFYELKRRGYRIAHNKIHLYLRETRRTTPNPSKQK